MSDDDSMNFRCREFVQLETFFARNLATEFVVTETYVRKHHPTLGSISFRFGVISLDNLERPHISKDY